jgi:hypothetical protein
LPENSACLSDSALRFLPVFFTRFRIKPHKDAEIQNPGKFEYIRPQHKKKNRIQPQKRIAGKREDQFENDKIDEENCGTQSITHIHCTIVKSWLRLRQLSAATTGLVHI